MARTYSCFSTSRHTRMFLHVLVCLRHIVCFTLLPFFLKFNFNVFPHSRQSIIHIRFCEHSEWTPHLHFQAAATSDNYRKGRYDVYCHGSATSGTFSSVCKLFLVTEWSKWESAAVWRGRKNTLKQPLTTQQQSNVWAEVNELKHAKTLKWSHRNTLREDFTCKNVLFHNMQTHTHTHIYIVSVQPRMKMKWALQNGPASTLALSLWQKTIMTHHNCQYKRW